MEEPLQFENDEEGQAWERARQVSPPRRLLGIDVGNRPSQVICSHWQDGKLVHVHQLDGQCALPAAGATCAPRSAAEGSSLLKELRAKKAATAVEMERLRLDLEHARPPSPQPSPGRSGLHCRRGPWKLWLRPGRP
jgi:hypothetical protein